MGIEPKELNPNSTGVPEGTTPQPLYWDERKKKLLDMVLQRSCTIKQIGEELNLAPWRVAKHIRDKEFQRRYTEIVEANTQQLLSENSRFVQELMRDLRTELKYKIKSLDPDKLLKEYRLLLQGISLPDKSKEKAPQFQQNIINPNLISSKVLKVIEEAILKEQGFKPLEVSYKEIKEVRNGKDPDPKKP